MQSQASGRSGTASDSAEQVPLTSAAAVSSELSPWPPKGRKWRVAVRSNWRRDPWLGCRAEGRPGPISEREDALPWAVHPEAAVLHQRERSRRQRQGLPQWALCLPFGTTPLWRSMHSGQQLLSWANLSHARSPLHRRNLP